MCTLHWMQASFSGWGAMGTGSMLLTPCLVLHTTISCEVVHGWRSSHALEESILPSVIPACESQEENGCSTDCLWPPGEAELVLRNVFSKMYWVWLVWQIDSPFSPVSSPSLVHPGVIGTVLSAISNQQKSFLKISYVMTCGRIVLLLMNETGWFSNVLTHIKIHSQGTKTDLAINIPQIQKLPSLSFVGEYGSANYIMASLVLSAAARRAAPMSVNQPARGMRLSPGEQRLSREWSHAASCNG